MTALLTIAGYSLTDTVVVFDRIRENLRTRLKEPVETVMNLSINEVLSRTIVTSLTVLLTSVALFFFGGEVLHDFSLAMNHRPVDRHLFVGFCGKPHGTPLGRQQTSCEEIVMR